MRRMIIPVLLACLAAVPVHSQGGSDPVSQAIAQGDLFFSKRKYDLALDAYQKADKAAHHNSATVDLKLVSVERKLGDFPTALEDTKRALKVAGDDKKAEMQAHLMRATLLTQMSGKPTDKKLVEAEQELRAAIAIDTSQPLAHFDLGIVLIKQEHDQDGVAELKAFCASPDANAADVESARRVISNPVRGREPFAPDFSFTTLEKENVSNASLRGKVVLIDFWGTWCPACRESLPSVKNIHKKYDGKDFELVGVSSDDDEDVLRTFAAAQHMNWPEYLDSSEKIITAFSVEAFPTYIVLDRDGVVRYRQAGFGPTSESDIEEVINKSLKRTTDPALAAMNSSAPETSATAAAPATNSTPGTVSKTAIGSPLSPLEDAEISKNTYTNHELGLAYTFPTGWTAQKPEVLHSVNIRRLAAAHAEFQKRQPNLPAGALLNSPTIIFYASRTGQGDGEQFYVPSITISAMSVGPAQFNFETYQGMMHQIAAAASLNTISPAEEISANGHTFWRTVFDQTLRDSHAQYAYIETVVDEYVVSFEIRASSADELKKIEATLQSITITDAP